jgi:adenylyltransferase/sulfurtransferase
VQATEAIKVITGKGDLLADRLFFWDGLNGEATTIIMKRNSNCEVCGEDGLEQGRDSQ